LTLDSRGVIIVFQHLYIYIYICSCAEVGSVRYQMQTLGSVKNENVQQLTCTGTRQLECTHIITTQQQIQCTHTQHHAWYNNGYYR
jgi:hypothetical protein